MKAKIFGIALSSILFLVLWHLASLTLNKAFLPTPVAAFAAFGRLCTSGQLMPQFMVSAMRVLVSILLGLLLAVPSGLAIGRSKLGYQMVAPLVSVLYPLPKVVFLPILVVLFGLGNLPKITLITLIIFFQIFVVVCDASRQLPQESVDAMRTLTNKKWAVFVHLLWPACLPQMLTSLRISIGTAVAVLFFAETFASFDGLGYLILDGMERRQYEDMYGAIIGMALLGILFYEVIYLIEKRSCRWLS